MEYYDNYVQRSSQIERPPELRDAMQHFEFYERNDSTALGTYGNAAKPKEDVKEVFSMRPSQGDKNREEN